MENKANQNKKAVQRTTPAKQAGRLKETVSKESSEDVSDASPVYPSSLNEELEELLRKNPRRFFGGCGG